MSGARLEANVAQNLRDVRSYATPAQIACRDARAASAHDAQGLNGRVLCDRPARPVLDAWYRASRTPDSERPSGTLAPTRTPQGPRALPDLPSERSSLTTVITMQPVALYAVPLLPPPRDVDIWSDTTSDIPTRTLAPPEPPPRA